MSQQHHQSTAVALRRSPSPSGNTTAGASQRIFGASSSTFDLATKKSRTGGGGVVDVTPVRRQFLEAEAQIHNNGKRRDLGEEGPAGPSPDTILHEPVLSSTAMMAMSSSSASAAAAAAPRALSPTAPSSPTKFTQAGMTPSMMVGTTKSVPARSRALQNAVAAAALPPRPASVTQLAPGGNALKRPGSASSSSAIGAGPNRTPTPSGAVAASFEDELTEISRLHDRERQQQNSVAAKKAAAAAAAAAVAGRQTSTPTNASSALGDLPSVDDLDAPMDATDNGSAANTATGKPIHVPYTPDLRAKLSAGTAVHSHVAPKPMVLRDFEMLAEACQRAGRARMEGHAYYKIGETYAKNKDTLAKSVTYFKRYLNICRRLNDLQGESKALNCLGIVYHELGTAVAATGNKVGAQNNYHIAMEYHKQHADIADAAGVFIANTNMGLLYAILGNLQAALECHKQALQYAVRAGDKSAESLALANLGQAGAKQGDIATARVCVERHLELATTLHDNDASSEAYEQLGILASQRNDFASASENFLLALDIAVRDNNQERAKQLRCQVGFAQGMLRMEQQMRAVATSMGGTPEPGA